jgi:cell division protein FtsW
MKNRSTDPWLIAIVAILVVLGLVMVYSASAVLAGESSGDETRYFSRQLISVVAGILLCVATAVTPTRVFRRYRLLFFAATVFGLVLCFVPGVSNEVNGARRWIGFGSVNLQPSEFAKIAIMIWLAHFLDRNRKRLGDRRVILQALAIPLLPMLLILLEPDFGTTAIIAGLTLTMLFIAGLRYVHLGILAGAGLIIGIPAMLMEQYRMNRLVSFMNPWETMDSEGYHIIQSWIAMHSGGIWGQGLGNSVAKLHFLPEPWTDFIGSVIAEELGLIRLVGVITLYALFVWRGLHIARRARDAFGMYLAGTITAVVGAEAFFNLAVIMGLVPPKGLVLPFISYGASAMMAHLWAVGILLCIAAEADSGVAVEGWPQRRDSPPSSSQAA